MFLTIKSVEDIDALQDINGVSIQEIEDRAKPLESKHDDIQRYACRSHMGYLGPHETFKERLKEDWNSLTPYELSHQDIARYLRKIIVKAKKVCGFNSKVPFKPIIIRFKAKGLKNSQTRLLKVIRTVYVGRQWSIFKNLDHVEEKDMTLEDKMFWNEEYTIKDVQTGISILISGNENDGILHYIRSYGFYEGGNMTPGAIQSLIEKIETKIEHCYIEYQEDIKKIDASSADQDEKKALTKIFRTKWKTSKEELEEEIRHLKSISVVK